MSKAKNYGFEISDGYNILMLRTEEGDYNEVLNVLNGIKQIDINALNKKGYTALALAVKSGFTEIAELLISRGANVNIRNNSGQSPLFLSCWCGFLEIVRLLLQYGAEINTTDQRGWSPLTIAAYHGNMEIVELLLMNNADVSIKDSFGKRAIHRAKDSKIIKMLQLAEVKSGLIQSIPVEKVNRPTTLKTEPDSKQSIMAAIADMLDKKPETTQGHRRLGSPHMSYNASPATKTNKNPSWQSSSQKKTNLSFDSKSIDLKASGKQSTTPRADADGETGKIISPKNMSGGPKQGKGVGLVLSCPSSATDPKAKKELEDVFTEEMNQVSEKIQDLIEEKIAFEVERQVQEYQMRLKQGIDTIVKTKISQSFNELQIAYNNHIKVLLTRLGFGEDVIRQAHFEIKDIKLPMNKEEPIKLQSEKERKAAEAKIQRMEKDIFINSKAVPAKPSPIKNGLVSPVNNRAGAKNKATTQQLSKNTKTQAESLLAHSKNKINEAVQNVGKTLHNNLLELASTTTDAVEENSKAKMENMMTNKFSQLTEFIASGSLSDADDKSFNEDSFHGRKTPIKEGVRGSETEIEQKAEQGMFEGRLSSPKVDKIKIPEKRYSFFKDKNEKYLDAVKEEEESAKDPQTVQDLKDSRLIEKEAGQKLIIETEDQIQDPRDKGPQKTALSKRDEDRSLNNLTPTYSESSGTLSSEFRLEGLKNYFGKKDGEGKILNKSASKGGSAPASVINTNRSQQGSAPIIPGHAFGFTNTKSVIQYDFDE